MVVDELENLFIEMLLQKILTTYRVSWIPHLVGDCRVDEDEQLLLSVGYVAHYLV